MTGSPLLGYIVHKRFRELKIKNPSRYNSSLRLIRIKLHCRGLGTIKRSIYEEMGLITNFLTCT